jgi:hypothetical protein
VTPQIKSPNPTRSRQRCCTTSLLAVTSDTLGPRSRWTGCHARSKARPLGLGGHIMKVALGVPKQKVSGSDTPSHGDAASWACPQPLLEALLTSPE